MVLTRPRKSPAAAVTASAMAGYPTYRVYEPPRRAAGGGAPTGPPEPGASDRPRGGAAPGRSPVSGPARVAGAAGGLRLGRVWGIPVTLDWSWILVMGLLTWSLAAGFFPREYPEFAPAAYWWLAATTAVLFCVSVLAHELAHAWVSVRHGLPVRGIRLYIFGGAAELAREPRHPGAEFRIAAVGPLASFLLAGLFWALWQLDRTVPYLAAPSEWLWRTNLALALFNLIPGFPLDGGRLLRAAVWRATGDVRRATSVAAGGGQLAALGLIGWGVFTMVGGGVLNGLWLVFLGWFLQQAAAASLASSTVEATLQGVAVAQVMSTERPQIDGRLTLEQLVEGHVLAGGRRTFFVTVPDGTVRGMLTLRDVTAVPRAEWGRTTAAQAMVAADRLVRVHPATPLLEALQVMDDAGVAQVPVLDGEAVEGVLTREGVLHYLRTRVELGI